jgi:hypothetical protein
MQQLRREVQLIVAPVHNDKDLKDKRMKRPSCITSQIENHPHPAAQPKVHYIQHVLGLGLNLALAADPQPRPSVPLREERTMLERGSVVISLSVAT